MSKVVHLAPDLPEVDIPPSRRRWVTDDEIGVIFNIPRDTLRAALLMLDSDPQSGYPKKSPVYKRRWLPALDDYYDEVFRPKIRLLGSHPHDR